MRNMKHASLLPNFNRWGRPALVAAVLLSVIALALLTVNFRPNFQGVNRSYPQFPIGPQGAAAALSARSQGTAITARRKADELLEVSPLRFEENRGQAVKDVQFLARANGSLVYLTRTAAVLALPPSRNLASARKLGLPPGLAERTGAETQSRPVLRMELANANPNARTFGSELLPGESNYFLGNNRTHWTTHIPNFARVRYEQVYPGIDLVYYGNHKQLEYDFVLAPGVDLDQVRLRLGGPRSVRLDSSGDLIMDVQGSQFLLRKPQAYQNGKTGKEGVRAGFALHGTNLVGLEVGAYDRHQPLIIDPVLTYSTYLGGSGGDSGSAVTVDSTGNIYLVGTTSSMNFPTTSGVVQPALAGTSNVFVTKLNPAGSPVFSTYLGGSGSDNGAGIAVDSAGNVYVTGTTNSANFPTTPGVGQPALNGPSDAFATELNPTGTSLVYSTYLGGSGNENGNGIVVDSSGNAYLTGATSSIDFPTSGGSFQPAFGGGSSDAFIAVLNPGATSLVYGSFLGGSGYDGGASVAIDASGEAIVTGTTSSTNFPTVTPLQGTLAGQANVFVTKVSSGGATLVFSTYLGGAGVDQGSALALDTGGNVYLTGSTTSKNFPTVSPAQSILGGGTDAFVSELKANGSALVYSTYLGGSGTDTGNGIALDSSGNAYVTGATTSSNFPAVNPIEGYTSTSTINQAFLAQIPPGGASFAYSTYLGGSSNDTASDVAVDSGGNAYIIGTTTSIDFPVTLGSFQTTFGKISNVFVSKVGPANQPGFSAFPIQFTFSAQGLGTTSNPQLLALRNMGSGVLNTNSITTTGDFGETNTCGGVVSGAARCLVSVTFSPTARGARSGTLVFSDNAPASPQTINLTGTGVDPIINLSPNSLTFPSEPLNTTAPTQTVTMNNSGVDASTITSISVSGDYTETNTCGTSLAVGATCTITVAFTPTQNGTRTGTLSVVDNSAGTPHTVSLTGMGVGPGVMLSSSSLTFTQQPLGTTSGLQVETLTNNGSASMTIAGIQTTGAFAETNTCGTSLAAGANCAINVTFSPTVSGISSGALTISDNAPFSPQTVVLSGNGVTGTAPVAYLSPNPMMFGSQPDSTTSAAQVLTLTNTGNASLSITNTSLMGNFTLGTNTCSTSLAAGASCTVQISSAPTSAGPTSGTFTVTDNASGSPHVANLVGSGTDFGMSVTPSTTTVTAGYTETYTITLTPVYGFKQTVNLACSGLPQAASCAFSPASETLDGTDTATAMVTVSTTTRSMQPGGGVRPGDPQFISPYMKFALGLLLTLAILTLLTIDRSRRRAWMLAGMLLLSLFWAACNIGAQKITGTPAGSYGIVITGTSTATGTTGTLQHSVQVGLVVN